MIASGGVLALAFVGISMFVMFSAKRKQRVAEVSVEKGSLIAPTQHVLVVPALEKKKTKTGAIVPQDDDEETAENELPAAKPMMLKPRQKPPPEPPKQLPGFGGVPLIVKELGEGAPAPLVDFGWNKGKAKNRRR